MSGTRARATGAQRSIEQYDHERDLVPDPHYAAEIAMLERSLVEDLGILSAQGLRATIDRLMFLHRIGPHFDGTRRVG